MITTTELQMVPIEKLVPYVNNARTHSREQIQKLRSSLREFGFINPVIIGRDFSIIAGHGRVLAAKEESIDAVPCVFVDHLTDVIVNRYIEQVGTDENVSVLRDGREYSYNEVKPDEDQQDVGDGGQPNLSDQTDPSIR